MRPSDAKVRKWKGADTFLHQPGKLRLISSEEDSEGRTDVGRFISRASGGLSGIRTRRSDANILITLALDDESRETPLTDPRRRSKWNWELVAVKELGVAT